MAAVVKLQDKHWVKRPLHNNIIEYVVAGVAPLWELGQRMMAKCGAFLVASAVRLTYASVEWHYDDQDRKYDDVLDR